MKRTITESEFIDAFKGSYADSFSYEGKKALYEYLTELEDSTGFEMELDVIAIHCEYTEYNSFDDWQQDYGDDNDINNVDDLQEFTQVIQFSGEFDNMIIVQDF